MFSTGKFTTTDTFVRIESLRELVRHARARARLHERVTLEAVRFYGWTDGGRLGFMPYFARTADDLGPTPRLGGKPLDESHVQSELPRRVAPSCRYRSLASLGTT